MPFVYAQEGSYQKPVFVTESSATTIHHNDPFRFARFKNLSGKTLKEENDDHLETETETFGILGSTFSTSKQSINNPNLNHQPPKEMHVLDAFYHAYTVDGNYIPNGFVTALGDGCGGHMGDTSQDKKIAQTSHFVTEKAAQFMTCCHSPEQLKHMIPNLVNTLAMHTSLEKTGENTTIVTARGFPVREGLRVVGFSIGDSMMIAYNPRTKMFKTLAPAITTVPERNFPSNFNSQDIYTIDETLEEDTIVIPLSKGIYTLLPLVESIAIIIQRPVIDKKLNPDFMVKLLSTLPENASVEDVIECIFETVCKNTESQRKELVEKVEEMLVEHQQAQSTIQKYAEIFKELHRPIQEKRNQLETLEKEQKETLEQEIRKQEEELLERTYDEDYTSAVRKSKEIERQLKDECKLGGDVGITGITLPKNRKLVLLQTLLETPAHHNPRYDDVVGEINPEEILNLMTTLIKKNPKYLLNSQSVIMKLEEKYSHIAETIFTFSKHTENPNLQLINSLQERINQINNNPFMFGNMKKRYALQSLLCDIEKAMRGDKKIQLSDLIDHWENSTAAVGTQLPEDSNKKNSDIINEHRLMFFSSWLEGKNTSTRDFVQNIKKNFRTLTLGKTV